MPHPEVVANGYVTPREECQVTGASARDGPGQGYGQRRLNATQQPDLASLAKMISSARKHRHEKKIGLRDRVSCHQWTWFTMTMVSSHPTIQLEAMERPFLTLSP
jgi:hypothetical protein